MALKLIVQLMNYDVICLFLCNGIAIIITFFMDTNNFFSPGGKLL